MSKLLEIAQQLTLMTDNNMTELFSLQGACKYFELRFQNLKHYVFFIKLSAIKQFCFKAWSLF